MQPSATAVPPPVIAVLQEQPAALAALLELRFGREYVVAAHTTVDGLVALTRRAAADGRRVALVIADLVLAGRSTIRALAGLRDVDDDVVRCVLLPFGDQDARYEISAAVSVGDIDRYFSVPWGEPDVGLYPAVTELLSGWWRSVSPATATPILVQVVAPAFSPRTHEMRDLLDRNSIPARFHPADGEAAAELRAAAGAGELDIVAVVPGGRLLVNPSNREVAEHLGARTQPSGSTVDVAVVGGGPGGLAAALYAASEGLRTIVIERDAIGGQAGTSAHIRNYPGFPHGVSGTELANRTAEQAWLFGVEFVNTNAVTSLTPDDDGHRLRLASGEDLVARVVVLASGVQYRRLPVPGIERLAGAGVFYGAARAEAPGMAGRRVFVVGAGNSAGQAAVNLARHAAEVTLLVRGRTLAASMSDYLIRQLRRTPGIAVRLGTEVVGVEGAHHLEALLLASDGERTAVPADGLFIMIGAEPKTDWLPPGIARDRHGFVVTGSTIGEQAGRRTPLPYETSLPGVFAVGDVRHGSVKRVASAVGEGAVCISSVHRYLEAEDAATGTEAERGP